MSKGEPKKAGLGKGRLSSFPFPLFRSAPWRVLLQLAEVLPIR